MPPARQISPDSANGIWIPDVTSITGLYSGDVNPVSDLHQKEDPLATVRTFLFPGRDSDGSESAPSA